MILSQCHPRRYTGAHSKPQAMTQQATQQASQPVLVSYVQERALAAVAQRFARINKQCDKLGLPHCRYELTGESRRVRTQNIETGRIAVVREVEVAVYGQAPKLEGGWELAAAMDLSTSVPLVLEVPGKHVDTNVRKRGNVCDHCGKRRARSQVFVLHNDAGQQKLVGRQCLADFLGSYATDPTKALQLWLSLGSSLTFDEDKLPRATPLVPVDELLGVTAQLVDKYGWVSRAMAQQSQSGTQGMRATASLASLYFFPPLNPQGELKRDVDALNEVCSVITSDTHAEVAAALEWACTLQPTNSFEGNLQALAQGELVPEHQFPIACWILVGFRKHQDRLKKAEFERAQGAASQHVGELKQRMERVLEFRETRVCESTFGTTWLCKFVDEQGNQFTWFASNSPADNDWKVGDKALARFTVKKHEEYKETRTTLVNRVVRLDSPTTTN